ncbi:ranBP-type and C3HC4-type zinc finger-containing protein 1-like [Uranotaenia lowii]|uniref:ranBP-type and C3HC4-type zinc finger-containing protein 1-like n=1 Tax=Uranotaenia lowii TaxID=190385 RepID=UPI00247A10A3|nr:ranBP-type and C3HC4-type zinc finger-containing protein 1-like [Uranotaenia lowii]
MESQTEAKTPQFQTFMEELLETENDLVPNLESSECNICSKVLTPKEGIVLKNCLHSYCKECLKASVMQTCPPSICCPYPNGRFECIGTMIDTELQKLLGPYDYQQFTLRQLENLAKEPRELSKDDMDKLLVLTDMSLVPNEDAFDCPICFETIAPHEGAILSECFHTVCRQCLTNTIKFSQKVEVVCPILKCCSIIQDCEIRSVLSNEDYCTFSKKMMDFFEINSNSFHCRRPNCTGWWIIENDNDSSIECPICRSYNCIVCKAIHGGMSCAEFQDRQLNGNATVDNRLTMQKISEMRQSRIAMPCPKCGVIIQKKDGCDGISCTYCKTAICWATLGPRWGPGGVGDTSGGCRCNVNGYKCNVNCRNCH